MQSSISVASLGGQASLDFGLVAAFEILGVISQGITGADIETISLTARRHALINERALDLGTVALAVINTVKGRPSLPQKDPLDPDQKRQLAVSLKEKGEVSGSDIARLLNVTRQAVYLYLKQDGDSQHG